MATSAKEKFDAAVTVIQSLPKEGSFQPSHDIMLKFYAYYKQAKMGACNISKPAFWDVVGKAKWDAWNKLGTMPQEEAMLNYVEELKKIVEAMPHTQMVQDFVEKLGNFYEVVEVCDDGSEKTAANKLKAMKPPPSPAKMNGSVNGSGHRPPDRLQQFQDCSDSEEEQEGDCEQLLSEQSLILQEVFALASSPGGLVNGHATHCRDTDTDSEEFCDTSDSQPDQVAGPDAAAVEEPLFSSLLSHQTTGQALVMRGGVSTAPEQQRASMASQQDSPQVPSSRTGWPVGLNPSENDNPSQLGAAGGGDRPPHFYSSQSRPNVNEQIAMALVRLQQDMSSVLSRLHTLEALSLAQHQVSRSRHVSESDQVNQSWWWPFPHLSSRTVFFIIFWPVILHVVFKALASRRNRCRPR